MNNNLQPTNEQKDLLKRAQNLGWKFEITRSVREIYKINQDLEPEYFAKTSLDYEDEWLFNGKNPQTGNQFKNASSWSFWTMLPALIKDTEK